MNLASARSECIADTYRETLTLAFEFGFPPLFSVEWMIDRAELGEWSGIWW